MKAAIYLVILALLLATSCITPIFAQVSIQHGSVQSPARPLVISALSVKEVPPPRKPQMKCFAYTRSASFSLADCRVTADHLTSYYSDGQLTKIVAKGHVTLTSKRTVRHAEFEATSETATYTYETGNIILRGKVQLSKYEGSGNAFGSHVKSVSYNVGNGTVGVSLPQYELYDVGKV